jgi:ATP-dependent DNA ligase
MTALDFQKLPKSRYLMEPKIDGWRLQVEADPSGIQAWTRTNHDATGKLPKVEEALLDYVSIMGCALRLDGEVVYLDKNGDPDFNFTSRCMGSYTETCVDKQQEEERWLSYVVFDILRVENNDLRTKPFEWRRETLESHLLEHSLYTPVIGVNMPDEEVHMYNIEKYGEGSVLKDILMPYPGKRHKSWLKWKAEETIDVTITGYKPGQGKFLGLIGAVTFLAPDGTIGNCSGMDDDTRIFISDHREVLLGKVIEIKHYGLLVDGYRHPQFVRFRDE